MQARVAQRRIRWSSVLAIGLVLSVGGCGEPPVDATRAAPADVLAVPSVLGDKRFEVAVSATPDAQPRVVAAGPGFAVLVEDNLTGYGADGAERWHYRPTGTEISDIHAYDDGGVLIAALPDELVAFDANTGQQLWTSQDEEVRGAFAGYHNPRQGNRDPEPPRFLAQSTGLFMTAFDPRTGQQTWRHSMGCSKTAYTPTQMVCLNVGPTHLAAAVVDAATGSRRPDINVPIPGAGRPQTWAFLGEEVAASESGVVLPFWFSSRTERDLPAPVVYLETASGASVPIGDDVTTVVGDDPRGGLLVGRRSEYYRPMTVALHDSTGAQRCVFGPDAELSDAEFTVTAWLDDQT